ncbi:hypothetical protein [Haloparvum sp. AD34]
MFLVLVVGVVFSMLHGSIAFETAVVERQNHVDVVSNENGVLSLSVSSGVHIGTTELLANTTNYLDQEVTVTLTVTGAATDYGNLSLSGTDVGDSTSYSLLNRESTEVDFDTDCDTSIVGENVTFDVSVEGTGISGTISAAVPIEDAACGSDGIRGVVHAGSSSRELHTARNGSKTSYGPQDIQVTGPQTTDLDGDGELEIPYVNDSTYVYAIDRSNEITVLFNASKHAGITNVGTDKSRIAVGTWDSSPISVFFNDKNQDQIYRADSDGAEHVISPTNGVRAVAAIYDIDEDGSDELLFVDGNQQLSYVEEDGSTIVTIANASISENNGIGIGSPADYNGDGTPRVAFVDGDGILSLVTADGNKTRLTEGGSKIQADMAPISAFDWDGDGEIEIVYVTGSKLYLADDIGDGTATTSRIIVDGQEIGVRVEPGAA